MACDPRGWVETAGFVSQNVDSRPAMADWAVRFYSWGFCCNWNFAVAGLDLGKCRPRSKFYSQLWNSQAVEQLVLNDPDRATLVQMLNEANTANMAVTRDTPSRSEMWNIWQWAICCQT
jgi:hypothetical protein